MFVCAHIGAWLIKQQRESRSGQLQGALCSLVDCRFINMTYWYICQWCLLL